MHPFTHPSMPAPYPSSELHYGDPHCTGVAIHAPIHPSIHPRPIPQQQAPLWRPSLYRGKLPCSSSKLHKGDPHCTGVFVHPTVWVWVCCWGWGWDCCWRVRYLTLVYCFTFCGRLEMPVLSSSSCFEAGGNTADNVPCFTVTSTAVLFATGPASRPTATPISYKLCHIEST